MGKSAPKAPAAPDPVAISQAQSTSNIDTARSQASLNMVDQVTPYGTLRYENFAPDRYRAITELSPDQARIQAQESAGTIRANDLGMEQLGRVGEALRAPIDFSGAPDASNRAAVEEASYARLNPSLEQARSSLEGRLKNQGLVPGTEAWTNAMRDDSQRQNDARLAVTMNAGQEEDRLIRQRQQYIQELMTKRQTPINEASALMGLGQVQMPSFVNTPQTQVGQTDVVGAYGLKQSADNAAYQAQVANTNSRNSAMASILGAGVTAGLGFGLRR